MKKYFLYELKKSAFPIGGITIILTLLYLAPLLAFDIFVNGRSGTGLKLWEISALGGFWAAILPLWLFGYKMKKRSLDLFYALPLGHGKILSVKFLVGLVALFIPYTVAYWLGAFVVIAKVSLNISAIYYLPHFFASLLPIYAIYSLATFAFTRANRWIDGVFFVLFWAFVLSTAIAFLSFIFSRLPTKLFEPYYYLPFAPLDYVTTLFQRLIIGNTASDGLTAVQLGNMIAGFTLTALMASGATAFTLLNEKKAKAENAEQISDSPFGYKVMIPLYTVYLIAVTINLLLDILLLFILVLLGAYMLTALYRRTMKIGWIQAAILAGSVIAGAILSLLMK